MTTHAPASPDLIDLFTRRLTAVGGHVQRAADAAGAAGVIGALAAEPGTTAWVSADLLDRAPGVTSALQAAGISVRQPEDPADVRDQPLGVAIAEGAVAETGSVIMVEPRIAQRAVTLMTEALVVLCPTAALLPSLDEAAPVLRAISAEGASYATLVTGPSRTADIERQLTVGVQGPGVYHVVLVDALD
jgi:L-lactate dehydrogenase complex protein LldG